MPEIELTEERLQHVLAVWPAIMKRAKTRGHDQFSIPPGLGDPSVNFHDALGPQLDSFYEGITENAAQVFRDHSRMIEIFGIMQRGGVAAERERMQAMGGDAFLSAMMKKMEASGAGNPEAVRAMLPQMKRNAEIAAERARSITDREVELVTKYMKEIGASIMASLP